MNTNSAITKLNNYGLIDNREVESEINAGAGI